MGNVRNDRINENIATSKEYEEKNVLILIRHGKYLNMWQSGRGNIMEVMYFSELTKCPV